MVTLKMVLRISEPSLLMRAPFCFFVPFPELTALLPSRSSLRLVPICLISRLQSDSAAGRV